jgi:quercetin dioxygenase-like cupin family protein
MSFAAFLACIALGCALPGRLPAEQVLVVKPLAEKSVSELPAGVLFWRIENYATLDQAKSAAGSWSLAAKSGGRIWLFTLMASGAAPSSSGVKVADVGPIPRVNAARYLLRINDATGPPGSATSIHSHPGSEAFFVLEGEQSIRGAHETLRVKAGQSEPGHGAGQAMQVSSSGSTSLHALVMFVVDADKPFSAPAVLPDAPQPSRR